MRLLPLLENAQRIVFIGLAKNTGKTTTLNAVVHEAQSKSKKLFLTSFGRDGEYRDAITQQRKPAISVPENSLYATLIPWAQPKDSLIWKSSWSTTLGHVGLYRCQKGSSMVELAGPNRVSRIHSLLQRTAQEGVDLCLIDGALNRKSCAIPSMAKKTLVSTGAVLGGSEESIALKTAEAITQLSLPPLNSTLLKTIHPLPNTVSTQKIWLLGEGTPRSISLPSFSSKDCSQEFPILFINGAFTDTLAKKIREVHFQGSILLKDATRNHLTTQMQLWLKNEGCSLHVLQSICVAAITVNPHHPQGRDLDAQKLQEAVAHQIPSIPVLNVKEHSPLGKHPGLRPGSV
ncbi:MAG: hypothetical protein MI717_01655 [Spirochaetales bacterium]|nr:hypothetical protein [Spirochaetales bacterium]